MRNRPAAVRPFYGPVSIELRAQWEALHHGPEDLWLPNAAAQSTYSQHAATPDLPLESFYASIVEGRNAGAGQQSCACRPASAWLDILPLTCALELKNGEVRTSLRHCLGLCLLPPNAPTAQCTCRAPQGPAGQPYAAPTSTMPCPTLAAQTTLHHDILKGILSRIMHRAGIASTLEPPVRHLPSFADDSGTYADGSGIRVEVREEILLAFPKASPSQTSPSSIPSPRQQRRQEQWQPEGISSAGRSSGRQKGSAEAGSVLV
jgi:hypothetical protein